MPRSTLIVPALLAAGLPISAMAAEITLPPLAATFPYEAGAPDRTADGLPIFRLCTGAANKPYDTVAGYIVGHTDKTKVHVQVLNGYGSWASLDAMASGECDGAIIQPDALAMAANLGYDIASHVSVGADLNQEIALTLCRRDGYDQIGDAENSSSTVVLVGGESSGTAVLFANWQYESPGYKATTVLFSPSLTEAAGMVEGKQAHCLISAQGLGGKELADVDDANGDALRIVDTIDKDFNDAVNRLGDPLYEVIDIDPTSYEVINDLATDIAGWDSNLTVVTWKAQLAVRSDYPIDDVRSGMLAASKAAGPAAATVGQGKE